MNPASAASGVVISSGASGMAIAGFVILSLVVVVLALALIQSRWPKSKAAQAFNDVEAYAKHFGEQAEAAVTQAEPALKEAVLKTEIGVGNELNALLTKAEVALTSTSNEDAAIAAAETYLARVTAEVQTSIATANAQKAAKLAAIQLHISNLTTAAGATGS